MNKQSKKRLFDLAIEKSKRRAPTMPDAARPVKKYTDKKANGLTTCIIDFINNSGYQAERISVTGRYRDTSITFTDVCGFTRRVGTGTYIKSSMKKGSADISATIKGKSVKIEVKIGADKMSSAQFEYQAAIQKAGGIYYVAKDFDSFLSWFDFEFGENDKDSF
jgi:hypothetical protein